MVVMVLKQENDVFYYLWVGADQIPLPHQDRVLQKGDVVRHMGTNYLINAEPYHTGRKSLSGKLIVLLIAEVMAETTAETPDAA